MLRGALCSTRYLEHFANPRPIARSDLEAAVANDVNVARVTEPLSRVFVERVSAFYTKRAAELGVNGAKTGAVTMVQRCSSDLRLNPHLHVVFVSTAWRSTRPSPRRNGTPSAKTSSPSSLNRRP